MSHSSEIIRSAKENLEGRWIQSVCVISLPIVTFLSVYLVISAIACFVQTISFDIIANTFMYLLAFSVVFPLILGVIRYYLKTVTSGDTANFLDTFYYFSSRRLYLRALRFEFTFLFKLFINAVICFLPMIIIALLNAPWFFSFMGANPPAWAAGLTFISAYLEFFGIILFAIFSFKLYLAPILIVADRNLLSLEALHISATIHKYSFSNFVWLTFRNIGLILLSVLGITTLYTVPLLIECYVVHFINEIENFNKSFEVRQVNTFAAFGE